MRAWRRIVPILESVACGFSRRIRSKAEPRALGHSMTLKSKVGAVLREIGFYAGAIQLFWPQATPMRFGRWTSQISGASGANSCEPFLCVEFPDCREIYRENVILMAI
jgi:hypothetical protein